MADPINVLTDTGLSYLSEKLYLKINDMADTKLVSLSSSTPEYISIDNTDPINPIITLTPTAIGKLDELLATPLTSPDE
jgi:hypothetical protein